MAVFGVLVRRLWSLVRRQQVDGGVDPVRHSQAATRHIPLVALDGPLRVVVIASRRDIAAARLRDGS